MNILHLSDLHFGIVNSGDTEFCSHYFCDDATNKPNPSKLQELLCTHISNPPDFLIISGDVGWSCIDDDYIYARNFLDLILSKWHSTEIIITPGNHDVNLINSTLEVDNKQDSFINFLNSFYTPAKFNALFPFVGMPFPPNKLSVRDRLIGFHYFPEKMLIVSVNSSSLINDFNDPAYIHPSILTLISRHINDLSIPRDIVKTFVLHHHLLPFAEPKWGATVDTDKLREQPDTSMISNSAEVQTWLASNNFHLILHGHKHIFHGRESLLWRESDHIKKSKLVILGAGSAGVHRNELAHAVKHSYNLINIHKLSNSRWKFKSNAYSFDETSINNGVKNEVSHCTTFGKKGNKKYYAYNCENMALAHNSICLDLKGKGQVENFISVIDDSTYIHPATTSIGEDFVPEELVKKSFSALHPEWSESEGWNFSEPNILSKSKNVQSYKIQHGTRLFDKIKYIEPVSSFNPMELRPILGALKQLPAFKTRAYVGLYNPPIDILPEYDPLPGLVGIQFKPRDNDEDILDIVLTFRNLELSFWWVVNMLEGRKILEWACKKVPQKPYTEGSVTIFSALAEWRTNPRPIFISDIDALPSEKKYLLLKKVDSNSSEAINDLIEMLHEKVEPTSILNIEFSGLDECLVIANSIYNEKKENKDTVGKLDSAFIKLLDNAVTSLKLAVIKSSDRNDKVGMAKRELNTLIKHLHNI